MLCWDRISPQISNKTCFFAKVLFTQNETSLGQLSLKYIGPKIWSNIPEYLKSSSPFSFGKQYKNVLLSYQNSCWSSFYILVTFCNIVLMPLFSLLSTSTVAHPTLVHRHAFPPRFFVCFFAYFTWPWFDAFITSLITFFTTCKTSSIKIWFVLATRLADKTQVVFRRPFVIQHVRTRLLNCETWNFRCFYICIDMKSICDLWCYCICSCCIRVISWFESQKCMNKPYTITLTPKGYTRLTANKIIRS